MTWLYTSFVFSNDVHDNSFIEGLVPFLKTNKVITACDMQCNYVEKNSKKFSLFIATTETTILKNNLLKFLEVFSYETFPRIEISSASTDPSFLSNTIQISLSKPAKHTFISDLSLIILDALKGEDIDDDIILTLCFYLQVALIKVCQDFNIEFLSDLKSADVGPNVQHLNGYSNTGDSISEDLDQNEVKIDYCLVNDVSFHKKFEEQREVFSQIFAEIINAENYITLPTWVSNWMVLCKTEIAKSGLSIFKAYLKIISEINFRLGITQESGYIILYFIQRVFGLKNSPNAIIMGCTKCGTSSLHFSLLSHSKIRGAVNPENKIPIKEVDFFWDKENWKKGLAWYFSHFVGTGSIFLDSSPNYLPSAFCFERIHTILPNAKLIICLRNPVYRAFSQYNYYKKILPLNSNLDCIPDEDFLTNIKKELNRIKQLSEEGPKAISEGVGFYGLLLRGVYIEQIRQLLKCYDRSQIYFSIMDQWQYNFEIEICSIQKFLGLREESLLPVIANEGEYFPEPLNDEAKKLLTEFYEPYNKKLFDFLGFEIAEWNI